MTSEELEALIDIKSEELRLHEKKTTEFLDGVHDDWTIDEFYVREATRDDMQERLAELHMQLGMTYRLEMLDEDCDKDHSLILTTVYNC